MSKLTTWLRRKTILRSKSKVPAGVKVGRESHGISERNFHNCTSDSPVDIGAFCSIAPEVLFLCKSDHPMNTASTFPLQARFFAINSKKANLQYLRSRGPIRVGNDVWIGTRATILSGVTIGDGAIIAAGSVVTKDVPPYTLVGGNPAKVIRQRFDQDTVNALLQIKWWDWPDIRLKAERDAFDLPAEAFARRYQVRQNFTRE
ncbi:MAG: CatB-related O-acetyltransferase [Mesorhizobium sp.]|nr:MAG: CatB-related O-acetyltransferase [Mesorhizobium sp.]